MTEPQTYEFQAEVHQVLGLVINSLYSNSEIFIRELVSNASDALDKLRFQAITEPELLRDDESLKIQLIPDMDAGTLTIIDTGIGMTREELVTNLGTVAHSGSKAFIERLKEAAEAARNDEVQLIGQFGVGFYSAFLVADQVEVISRAAGADEAWRWTSSAERTFTVEPAERDARGTEIILHLKEEQRELLHGWKLRSLIKRYSDYVNHPIEMEVTETVGEGDDQETTTKFEVINQSAALWRRSPSDITEEQYQEFYQHLTHDWEPSLTHTHFKIEGTQQFTGLLFIPKRPPFDLFDRDQRGGVQLYVKRVFIMDECEELLPKWLRFVRGIIDSDDLSLNVSRELLQDSRITRTIRKQVIKKVLSMLEDLADEQPDDYLAFWERYGVVLKEGLHFDPKYKDQLARLLRFRSTRTTAATDEDSPEWTSLSAYVESKPMKQKAIYYIQGPSLKMVESSPHLETLRSRGYEVLYLTDTIDQWVLDGLKEFEDTPLVSALDADLKLDEDDEEKASAREEQATAFKGLTERINAILDDRVKEVRLSERLTDSPACLVLPEGGLPSYIERLLRANQQDIPATKRILEINPTHPLIENLKSLSEAGEATEDVSSWIELLYDQALLTEGSPIDDPARFASRMTRLMQTAVASKVDAQP
ncbi:MAG: molecular chaperone HtpG [Myxococcales bacterium]|nr:molecular chaperone HtpG [Myxococcales bacterium]